VLVTAAKESPPSSRQPASSPTAAILAEVEGRDGAGGLRVGSGRAGVRFGGRVEPKGGRGGINIVAEDKGAAVLVFEVAGQHGIGVGAIGDIETECPGAALVRMPA